MIRNLVLKKVAAAGYAIDKVRNIVDDTVKGADTVNMKKLSIKFIIRVYILK